MVSKRQRKSMKPRLNAMKDDKAQNEIQKNDDGSADTQVEMGEKISSEDVDRRSNTKKINEIFRPKKMKKYRSLADIYRVTKPIDSEN
ncbi:unnamed protein product [Lathyrus oleraceus]